MNVNFYKKLLSFRTHSRSEMQLIFRDWLRNYIIENFENIQTDIDKYGNLYVQKGDAETVNCVIAHLDINQKTKCDDVHIMVLEEWILGINKTTGLQIGLGHDDKAGVYFALQALKKFENIKVFFPLDEEVGLVGTRAHEPIFFDNVGFMVQLDRRGYKDISSYTNGCDVVTKETQEEFKETCTKFGYDFARCISTDVGHLVEKLEIQGVNISCGYYDEHSDKEVLSIRDYDNAEKFAMSILKLTNGKTYTIQQKRYTPPSYSGSYKGGSTGTNSRQSPTFSKTNSKVGSPLTVVQRKSNANDHLIIRDEKKDLTTTSTVPSVKTEIETYNKPATFVSSSRIFTVNDVDDEVPTVMKTLEDKAGGFQFSWHNGADIEEMSLNETEVLIHGYKQLINYLLKETTIPDEELLDTLRTLEVEMELVEQAGNHDLQDPKEFLQMQINLVQSYVRTGGIDD